LQAQSSLGVRTQHDNDHEEEEEDRALEKSFAHGIDISSLKTIDGVTPGDYGRQKKERTKQKMNTS